MRHRDLLPTLGTPAERLVSEYGMHLVHQLTREQVAPVVAQEVETAVRGLRSAVEARKLAMRLAACAESLAEDAELHAEQEIRALHEALATERQPLTEFFPDGIGASLAPRGDGQVLEVQRLLSASHQQEMPPSIAAALVRLGVANATLASRLAASASAHEALLATMVSEQQSERRFRHCYRWALGALTGLFPEDLARVEGFFNLPLKSTAPSSLPAAPPPTDPEANTA